MSKEMKERIEEMRYLKEKNGVLILAHYYMSPDLQVLYKDGGIADYLGDSLALSMAAQTGKAEHIIFCGVRFMAETAKILNSEAKVYIPDTEAGCSLAESINAEQVKGLRERYPGVPVIAYINTYAETKAECDVICTSRNALPIAQSFEEDTLLFIPDKFMGQNLSKRVADLTGKKLILWNGTCEVHEQFRSAEMGMLQSAYPEAELLMHWEVPSATVNDAFAKQGGVLGSTSDIISYVGKSDRKQFILASECDLGAVLKSTYSEKEFITPCIRCPYMKKITLENTLDLLRSIDKGESDHREIHLDPVVAQRALLPLQRMLSFS